MGNHTKKKMSKASFLIAILLLAVVAQGAQLKSTTESFPTNMGMVPSQMGMTPFYHPMAFWWYWMWMQQMQMQQQQANTQPANGNQQPVTAPEVVGEGAGSLDPQNGGAMMRLQSMMIQNMANNMNRFD